MAKRVASQWIPGAREDDGPSGEGGATQRQEAEKLGEGRAAKDEEQEGDDFEDEQEDYSHGGEDDIGDEDLLDEDDEALDALADEDDEVGDYAFPEGEVQGVGRSVCTYLLPCMQEGALRPASTPSSLLPRQGGDMAALGTSSAVPTLSMLRRALLSQGLPLVPT